MAETHQKANIVKMTDAQLADLVAKAQAATPGPWHQGESYPSEIYRYGSVIATVWPLSLASPTAVYIAAASPDVVLALVAEVQKARAVRPITVSELLTALGAAQAPIDSRHITALIAALSEKMQEPQL